MLADHVGAIHKIATWIYDEWLGVDSVVPFDKVVANTTLSASRYHPPLMVVAKTSEAGREDEIIGCAELKVRENRAYPEYEFWLGGVYVQADFRGKGVASMMCRDAMQRARQVGVACLYLQTKDLSGGLYTELGFTPVEITHYKGRDILIMQCELADSPQSP